MKNLYAYMMLIVFAGFMTGIAADFSLYLTFINGGNDVESTTVLPEECQEESESGSSNDGEYQTHQAPGELLELAFFDPFSETARGCWSVDPENGFYDIPYSPPERI